MLQPARVCKHSITLLPSYCLNVTSIMYYHTMYRCDCSLFFYEDIMNSSTMFEDK